MTHPLALVVSHEHRLRLGDVRIASVFEEVCLRRRRHKHSLMRRRFGKEGHAGERGGGVTVVEGVALAGPAGKRIDARGGALAKVGGGG